MLRNKVRGHPKQHQEPVGFKKHIKILVNKEIPLTPRIYRTFNAKSLTYARCFKIQHCIKAPVENISTKLELVYLIRQNFGYGRFQLWFWSDFVRSKKYARYGYRFVCIPRQCGYFNANKCIRWRIHKKGDQCKMNRPYRPNWKKKFEVSIIQKDTGFADVDFVFKVHYNTMYTYRNWFWKG